MNQPCVPVAQYEFLRTAGRILNSGQSRSLVLTGNIADLFFCPAAPSNIPGGAQLPEGEAYVPLLELLTRQWSLPGKIIILYELNGPVRFFSEVQRSLVREAWLRWRTGLDESGFALQNLLSGGKAQNERQRQAQRFDEWMEETTGRPTLALEFLRQLCLASRATQKGAKLLTEELIIVIEAADLLIPDSEMARLSESDRQRVAICCDWFSDPGFCSGDDSVVLLAESRSQLNGRIARLPQLLEVPVPSPGLAARECVIRHFLRMQNTPCNTARSSLPEGVFCGKEMSGQKQKGLEENPAALALLTAGLSVHALRQLLINAAHTNSGLSSRDIMAKVEEFAQSQLGEGVIEFKKPTHTLDSVIGFTKLKKFLRSEFIPRCQAGTQAALSGAAVCGPIGGGKSFIFEAVAGELDMIVLVLKNIRSQWYGQTDVIFERLRRLLESLPKALILVDEADTQFGGVGADTHETERRLTGRIQAMMSDPELRGRVIWLLMTARVNLLSPDLRRPGRVGDLIIPVLDPQGDDRTAFIQWSVKAGVGRSLEAEELESIAPLMQDYSAAAFSSLRSELVASKMLNGGDLSIEAVRFVIEDRLPPDIALMRRYQELQALINCTRRSLLPSSEFTLAAREEWRQEVRQLEQMGCR